MKRFYLTGQRAFSNRGCEAIVRGTAVALKEVFGDIEILVPSDNALLDARQWPEADTFGVRFVEYYNPWFLRYWIHLQRLPIGWLKRSGWPFPFPKWLRQQIQSADVVLSVGGDNYSLDYRLPSLLMGLDRLGSSFRTPVILWGGSVGPFDKEPQFLPAITEHLARLDRIFVRESVSYRYLTDNRKLDNVELMVDPAFLLAPQFVDTEAFWPKAGGNGVIGLNVSPLIERYVSKDQDLKAIFVNFIETLIKSRGYSVVLIPHVVPLDGSDENDDETYMQSILKSCHQLEGRVKMAPRGLNAAQLKSVLARCRFVVGARTHATIAALSSGVPTISIAYSVKARGINRDLFGHENSVLLTPDVSSLSLLEKIDYLERNESTLQDALRRQVPIYRSRVIAAAQNLLK